MQTEDFSISPTYLAFYDKLEKANLFFENILHFAAQELDDRETFTLLGNPLPDGRPVGYGGQPHQKVRRRALLGDAGDGALHRHGQVPAHPEPQAARGCAGAPRPCREGKDPSAAREEMLAEVYNALRILYGQPPKTFDFEYTDTDKVYHCDRGLTPKQFLDKYVGSDFDDYAVIIASPIHAVNRTYCQPFMGDVVEDGMFWLNLSQEELEDLTIRQLQAGEGVMFSCDCHPDGDRANGYWDPDCFQYGEVLGGLTFGMTKSERLLTRDSTMNHCMMFCGVNLDENGTANRWKIENSWGEESGQKGYYIGSEKWFQANVYQVTVRKSLLSDAQRALLAQEPLPMKLWDPLA